MSFLDDIANGGNTDVFKDETSKQSGKYIRLGLNYSVITNIGFDQWGNITMKFKTVGKDTTETRLVSFKYADSGFKYKEDNDTALENSLVRLLISLDVDMSEISKGMVGARDNTQALYDIISPIINKAISSEKIIDIFVRSDARERRDGYNLNDKGYFWKELAFTDFKQPLVTVPHTANNWEKYEKSISETNQLDISEYGECKLNDDNTQLICGDKTIELSTLIPDYHLADVVGIVGTNIVYEYPAGLKYYRFVDGKVEFHPFQRSGEFVNSEYYSLKPFEVGTDEPMDSSPAPTNDLPFLT